MKNWQDCINNFSAKQSTPDNQKAKSLQEVAIARIKNTNKNITQDSANFIFEDYYTSILEILQAIITKKGFKINNHICLGYFLRDILKKENLFRQFDDLRFKRNSLVYYGKRMDLEISLEAIRKSKQLFKELNNILKTC